MEGLNKHFKGLNEQQLQTWLLHVPLVIATLASLGVKTHGNATVVVFIVVSGAIAFALKRHAVKSIHKHEYVAWVISALMVEALLWMWAAITAQIVVTCVLFCALLICCGFSNYQVPTPLAATVWLVLRATAITVLEGNSSVATWYAAQLILLVLIVMHVRSRTTKQNTTSFSPLLVTGGLIVVFILYSTPGTMPANINILLVMAPLLFLITVTVKETPQVKHLRIISQESALIIVILICIAISMAWDHNADEDSSSTLCDRTNYNTRECFSHDDIVAGRTKCCCIRGFHYVLGTNGCARQHCLFTQNKNTNLLKQNNALIDCCSREVLPGLHNLRAGPDMCMCGNTKTNPGQHGYSVAGKTVTCRCANGYTGPYCLQRNVTQNSDYS